MDELIRKYVLQNSLKYEGRPNQGAVIGKILGEKPELKSDVKALATKVAGVIADIKGLSLADQTKELETLAPELLKVEKKERKAELKELKNPKHVVMRFEPSPSGALHIGHAYVLSLNSEYCRKYKGKLILRIGDTNPENTYLPAYQLIEEDAKWVTKDNVSKVLIQSERLDLYYKYMEKLIDLDKVYICECDPEAHRELLRMKKGCACRELPKKDTLERWKKMFDGYNKGDVVARLKTDIEHKNPAMRDFPLFRINDAKHPRAGTKNRVWPLMNMAVAVDDIETKVTHVIRAKDHHDNALRQKFIYEYLEKDFPEAIFVGRINFDGMPVSATKTREAISEEKYSGWDDIRLPFLQALRKRGYQPEALIKYAIDVGTSLSDKTVTKEDFFKTIDAFNKDIIDKKSDRHFFVWNPTEIEIKNAPEQEIVLDLHPEKRKGGRDFMTKDRFFISEDDLETFEEGKLYRLMDCLNFVKKGESFEFHSTSYDEYKKNGAAIIHWLPFGKDVIDVTVRMPDNSLVKGVGEKLIGTLKEESIFQAERFGFISKQQTEYWFLHK